MSRTKQLDNLYLQFLAQAQAMQGAVALDAIEQKLLNLVAQAVHTTQEPLSVTDLLECDDIASPATLHKRLTNLRKAKLVAYQPAPNAYPRKEVVLTNKAIEHFNALSKSMRKAVKKGGKV